jgi:hypothetical protein
VDGTFTTISAPGLIYGINDSDQMIEYGVYGQPAFRDTKGVISQIVAPEFCTVIKARAINGSDQIVGLSTNVPEPSSVALLYSAPTAPAIFCAMLRLQFGLVRRRAGRPKMEIPV